MSKKTRREWYKEADIDSAPEFADRLGRIITAEQFNAEVMAAHVVVEEAPKPPPKRRGRPRK